MKLSLVGVGLLLSSEDGYTTIKRVIPGGPADRDGTIKVNDKIIAVGQKLEEEQVDVIDMKLRNVVKMIRGKKGALVRLYIQRDDSAGDHEEIEVILERDKIDLSEQEAKAEVIEFPSGNGTLKLGKIDVPSFYADIKQLRLNNPDAKSTTKDVRELIELLKKENIRGLILDFRRNGGGLLSEAITLTGLFIDEGPVVLVKDARGRVKIWADDESGIVYDGPMLVLTSKLTASASEIVAGALQAYNRAVIVGDPKTHGKGTVQSIVELAPVRRIMRFNRDEHFSAVKVTVQKFYLPNGNSTQNKGIEVDIPLPSIYTYLPVGEDNLPFALPWDEIDPTDYVRHDSPVSQAIIDQMLSRSEIRINADPEFAYLREDIDRLKKEMENKKISLNKKKRVEKKDRLKKIKEQRKIERKERSFSPSEAKSILLPNSKKNKESTEKSKDKKTEEDKTEEEEDKDGPDYDIHLYEAYNILADLINLSNSLSLQGHISHEETHL